MMKASTPEILRAAEILGRGGVVGIPTETVYGLAGSIQSAKAISKIFEIKERPFFDPLIVHISNAVQLSDVVKDFPDLAEYLSKKFWPGPLTMVLKRNASLNTMITSGLETVAIRMPNQKMTLELIDLVGPLAAPSANKFGKTSPTTAQHVREEFIKEDLFVLDGGPAEIGLESTVISIEGNEIKILRPGMISEENLRSAVVGYGESVSIEYAKSSAAPGNLEHHYQPKIPLYIFDQTVSNEEVSHKLHFKKWKELKLAPVLPLAARSLYQSMRELSDEQIDAMVFFKSQENSSREWLPIWDRLTKASSELR